MPLPGVGAVLAAFKLAFRCLVCAKSSEKAKFSRTRRSREQSICPRFFIFGIVLGLVKRLRV